MDESDSNDTARPLGNDPLAFKEWTSANTAFTVSETEEIRSLFDRHVEPSVASFSGIPPNLAPWVYQRMLDLAKKADEESVY